MIKFHAHCLLLIFVDIIDIPGKAIESVQKKNIDGRTAKHFDVVAAHGDDRGL